MVAARIKVDIEFAKLISNYMKAENLSLSKNDCVTILKRFTDIKNLKEYPQVIKMLFETAEKDIPVELLAFVK